MERSTPFTDLAPRWAQLARSVATQYDPTQLIIAALERLHHCGVTPATIDGVAREACRLNQPLTVEVFFTQTRREDVLTAAADINESVLTDPTVYKSGFHPKKEAICNVRRPPALSARGAVTGVAELRKYQM